MKPYYEQDGITIYHGDNLDILPELTHHDAVITDPPWKIDLRSTSGTSLWGDLANAGRLLSMVLSECQRLTVDNGSVWMFHAWKFSPALLRASDLVGWPIESMLVWDRCWPNVGTMKGLRATYETIALWCHANFAIANRSLTDIWQYKWTPSDREYHPAEKPYGLIRQIIDITQAESVIDPFMGSGSTLLAAKYAGLRGTGIEIDEKYCEIAANRLQQHVMVLA